MSLYSGRGETPWGRTIAAALMIIAALVVVRLWLNVSFVATRKATLVGVAVMVVVLLLFALVGVKFFDLSGRREERAERVQNRIAERLRGTLSEVPFTVVAAYVSVSPRSPLVVEITGRVPSEAVRARALELARHEASRLGRDVRVADRLEVQSAATRRAA
jgi:hypothetical protein